MSNPFFRMAVCICMAAVPFVVSAQDDDSRIEEEESEPRLPAPPITIDRTDSIVGSINEAKEFCDQFVLELRIHCLSAQLRKALERVPERGDYAPVHEALEELTDGLDEVARRYGDKSARPLRYKARRPGGNGFYTTPPLITTAPDSIARATDEAAALIRESQTKLLRSAENSRRRAAAFRTIASAVDSTKVLLRST